MPAPGEMMKPDPHDDVGQGQHHWAGWLGSFTREDGDTQRDVAPVRGIATKHHAGEIAYSQTPTGKRSDFVEFEFRNLRVPSSRVGRFVAR